MLASVVMHCALLVVSRFELMKDVSLIPCFACRESVACVYGVFLNALKFFGINIFWIILVEVLVFLVRYAVTAKSHIKYSVFS